MARKAKRVTKAKTAKKKPARRGGKGKKMRISHIHWGFPPIIGGVETHLAMMLPTFVRMGHRAYLLTGSVEDHPLRHNFHGAWIRRTPLMDLNWLFKRGLANLDEEIHQMYTSYVDDTKPDIIHTHNMHYFSKPHAEILAEVCKKKGVPLILTAHNVWDENLYLNLTRNVPWDYIIAVSHYIKRELVGVGADENRCTVIHHGIDHNTFRPDIPTGTTYRKYPQLRGKRVIFHPARMGIAKGCDVSIKAFNIVHQRFPDTMLVLAGTKNIIDWGTTQQKDIAYFLSLVKFFDLEDSVMIDAYTLDQMPGLYGASDVVIYPSSAMEPFGLTMLEGMATAKPMIVTNVGGMPEIIHDSINGFVVPIRDFEALAGRISRLLAEDRLRERFGRTGRQMVERHFTKEHMTQNHLDIYKSLI
jgi:glycosyltransferase involved in cell wall biosynthesis